ncbi:hypothetical protein BVC80_8895g8 [Macleaya cordata]|uniref:Reverse transcriptase zinc-binding domain n=1 Tax=Macleaya cordata TaxID=56857 RepID=A0A200Q3W7_MACCD|nr:hypothetical protein BVC80_8895g8 [Macleaya cordata]
MGDHIFLHCPIAREVWDFISSSFNITACAPPTVELLLCSWHRFKLPVKGRKLWQAIPYAVIWTLWKTRNEAVFQNEEVSFPKIILLLKGTLFYWSRGQE